MEIRRFIAYAISRVKHTVVNHPHANVAYFGLIWKIDQVLIWGYGLAQKGRM